MDKKDAKAYNIIDKIKGNKKCQQTLVAELKGYDLKYSHFQEHGFKSPILIKDKSGLGMRVPSQNFTICDIKKCIGSKKTVQVTTCKDEKKGMSMEEFARVMETKKEELKALERFNFTGSKMDTYVEQPKVVQQLDWANFLISPKQNCDVGTFSSKAKRFFSMTMSGHFNNFEISLQSQWIHLLHGKMILWLIGPTSESYRSFSEWKSSGEKNFFGDEVVACQRLKVEHGWTLFIPSGWIVAHYTLEDALVISGLFLNCFSMTNQIEAYKVMRELNIEDSNDFMCFKQKLWYILDSYLEVITGHSRRHQSRDEMGQGHEKVASSSNEDTDVEDVTNDLEETKLQASETSSSSSSASNVIKVVSAKLQNCLLSQSKSEAKASPTGHELDGLKCVVDFLLADGFIDFPFDLSHPDDIISDVKKLLQENNINSDFKMSITGKPIMSFKANEVSSHQPNYNAEHLNKILPTSSSSSTNVPPLAPSSGHGGSSGAQPLDPSAPCIWTGKDSALRRRRVRCKRCEPCTRGECGECHFCKDMKKFGGQGKMKQTCTSRQCLAPNLSTSAVCSLCGQGDFLHTPTTLPHHPTTSTDQSIVGDDTSAPDQYPESSVKVAQKCPDPLIIIINNNLMECSICWKITHPLCFKLTHPELNNIESVINDDLPNSWDCPTCCEAGKSVHKKSKPVKFCTNPLVPSVPSLPSSSSSSRMTSSSPTSTPMKKRDSDSEDDDDCEDETFLSGTTLGTAGKEKISKKVSKNCKSLESHKARKRNWCESTSCMEDKKMKLNSSDDPISKDMFKTTPISDITSLPIKCNQILSSTINLTASSSNTEPSYPLGPIAPQFVVRPILSNPPPKFLPMGDDGLSTHSLRMEHWLRIFGYLKVKDLLACKSVCKTWNCWCYYAPLWKRMDLSRRKIKKIHLVAMAKHQPKILDLSHSDMTKNQMSWLIEHLFHLRRLKLEGCSLSAVCSLFFTCSCPVLTHLDLSWVSRLNDSSVKALLSSPTDNKPGVTTTGCRLKNCIELKLAGTEVGIASVELISKTLMKLQLLDLSYCIEINSKALEFLANGIQSCSIQTNQQTPSKNQSQQSQAGKQHQLKHSPITVQGISSSHQLLAGSQPHCSQSASTSPSPININNQDHMNSNLSSTLPPCHNIMLPLPHLKRLLLIGCHWIDSTTTAQTKNIRTQLEIIHLMES